MGVDPGAISGAGVDIYGRGFAPMYCSNARWLVKSFYFVSIFTFEIIYGWRKAIVYFYRLESFTLLIEVAIFDRKWVCFDLNLLYWRSSSPMNSSVPIN